jgi:glycosyltransferase involved in cell wall biosynthesis
MRPRTTESPDPVVASVVISSYNYAEYLPDCIESALAQTYPRTEVIVVDDGSTDESPRIIHEYGRQVVHLFQDNRGQAASINAGFRASHGQVVLFLDSDDLLDPSAVSRSVDLLEAGAVKVHWPLVVIDGDGKPTGRLQPASPLGAGDLRQWALTSCPANYPWPPTTGNAWSRSFLERVLPIPEEMFRTSPDYCLCTLAPLYGPIAAVAEPLGAWRFHGRNASIPQIYEDLIRRGLRLAEAGLKLAEQHCIRLGVVPDPVAWRVDSYEHRMYRAACDVSRVIPDGEWFALADGGQWGVNVRLGGRHAVPFLGRDGQYWGDPPHDRAAIEELHRLRGAGLRWLVVAWPCYWWCTFYREFAVFLDEVFTCRLRTEEVQIYSIDPA